MATRTWLGGAQAVRQINTVTPASVAVGNVFAITVNSKAVTFTATAGTVANVTAGLAAAVAASAEPEFQELTATDQTTYLQLTGPSDGRPFTQTSSASGGTATNTTATATAAGGPNSWAVAANWSGGAVPVNSDDVIIGTPVPILYGLDQNAVTLASLTVTPEFTAAIGLPARNAAGYAEYRETYLKISATAVTVQCGSGRVKLNVGTAQTTLNVLATGQPADAGLEALVWVGTHASNAVNVTSGSVGLAVLPGSAATVATLRVGGSGSGSARVRGGSGLSLTTLKQTGGQVTLNAGLTTVNKTDGTLTVLGSGAVTTLNNDGGTTYYQSSGTITTLNCGADSVMDFRGDARARTVTDCTLQKGSQLLDDGGTVTFTNGFVLNRCSQQDVVMNTGTHRTYTVAAGP